MKLLDWEAGMGRAAAGLALIAALALGACGSKTVDPLKSDGSGSNYDATSGDGGQGNTDGGKDDAIGADAADGGTGGDAGDSSVADGEGGPSSGTDDLGEVFIGPFASWANAKTDYHATADGTTDDTGALQTALDELGQTGKKRVLYLPAGTYRLTGTLKLASRGDVAILGEDPATTTLVWDGPYNSGPDYSINTGVMFLGQGATRIRLGRLTFDGKKKANWAIRWRWGSYGSGEPFPSGMEQHDLTIRDVDVGIGGGYYDGTAPQDTAEYSHVHRSHFIGCSRGIETAEYNSLLWGVMDSTFDDDDVGVAVTLGNVNVYDSIFRRSRTADIQAGTVPLVSARGNYSTGSKSFFTFAGNTGTATLQNNTIVSPQGIPIAGGTCCGSPLISLIGNSIDSGTATAVKLDWYVGMLSAGNRLSAANWLSASASVFKRSLDDSAGVAISATEPTLPPTPARFTGPIITVAAFTGAAVQTAIDAAVTQYAGQRVVVYLPAGGNYKVSSTITVPANADIHLVGDGRGSTTLEWTGGANGTILKLAGPSRARVQDVGTSGGYNGSSADNLVVANADQPGGSIVMYGLDNTGANTSDYAVSIDGVDHTTVEILLPWYLSGPKGAIRVTGGPDAKAPSDAPANVRYVDGFPGTAGKDSAAAPVFTCQVTAGGQLLMDEVWGETTNKHFIQLKDAATVTVNSVSFGYDAPATNPANISAEGFRGRLTLVGLLLGSVNVASSGSNPDQNVLLALSGFGGWGLGVDQSKLTNTSTAGATKGLLDVGGNVKFDSNPPNDPNIDDAWLRSMLAQLRADRSLRRTPTPAGATNVRTFRFGSNIANTAVRVIR